MDFVVHNGVGEVADGGVGGNGSVLLGKLIFHLIRHQFTVNIGNGIIKLFRKVGIFIGYTGSFGTEPSGYHLHLTKNHFRVLHEVAVHFDAVLGGVKLYPLRFDVDDPVPLLQDENVRYDLCSGVALKGVVR